MCEGAWPRGVTVTVTGSVTAPGPVSAGGAGPEVGTAKKTKKERTWVKVRGETWLAPT